jgi:hypothetical protein
LRRLHLAGFGAPRDNSAAVAINNGTQAGSITLSAAASIQNSTIGSIVFRTGSSGATVTGNTFTSTVPIRIDDPNLLLSGVTGNTYAPNSVIYIGGTLSSSHTLGMLDGLNQYVLTEGLTVNSGTTLTIASGVQVRTNGYAGAYLNIYGTLNASGVSFTDVYSAGWTAIQVNNGGTGNLANCEFSNNESVTYSSGSSGTISGCTAIGTNFTVDSAVRGRPNPATRRRLKTSHLEEGEVLRTPRLAGGPPVEARHGERAQDGRGLHDLRAPGAGLVPAAHCPGAGHRPGDGHALRPVGGSGLGRGASRGAARLRAAKTSHGASRVRA